MEEKIRKVLIIRLSSLGDLVILSSLIEFLYKRGVKIHLALYRQFAELYEGDFRIYKLIPIERTLRGKIEGFKKIREENYDLVVDAHRKIYPTMMTLFAKTDRRAFVKKNSWERRCAVIFKKKIEEKPLYRLYIESVRDYFDSEKYPPPILVNAKKPDIELPSNYAVFVPGASKNTKQWPLEYYIELGKRVIEELKIPVILIGKEYYGRDFPEGFINLLQNTKLRELLYILKNAEFVVSNDTGPAHMAASQGTPLFVIFGPTIPEFGFRPAGSGFVKVIEKDLPCRPCSLHGLHRCPLDHFKCMLEIKPEEVLNEIKGFYSRGSH